MIISIFWKSKKSLDVLAKKMRFETLVATVLAVDTLAKLGSDNARDFVSFSSAIYGLHKKLYTRSHLTATEEFKAAVAKHELNSDHPSVGYVDAARAKRHRKTLSGTIPIWIGQLSHLFYLDLSLNSLTEDIPESFGNLGNLTDLNLSSMADLSSSFSVYLSTPGRQSLRYKRIWNLPPTVDLSNNMLAGTVLSDLGNLMWLHVLKLSNNSFSGNILDTLSGMENLESMDLSLNNLSGEIPLSLINLYFLSNFNVSFNKLYGAVPSGGQFFTFPSSCFIGNSDLCGLPLVPCRSVSCQIDQKRYAKPPAEERSAMAHLGPAFEIGGVLGFVLTVWFCFRSGWVFKE